MKRQQSAASTKAIHARHMIARLLRSFLFIKSVSVFCIDTWIRVLVYLTNGSLTLEKFMNVYSLYPARARMGSSMYW
jgi:hypothetical protein